MLDQLKKSISEKDFIKSFNALFTLLHTLENTSDLTEGYIVNREDERIINFCRACCEQLNLFLTEPSFNLSIQQYYALVIFQPLIQALEELSGSSVINELQEKFENKLLSLHQSGLNKTKQYQQILQKYLICSSIEKNISKKIESIYERNPQYALPHAMSVLTEFTYEERTKKNYETIFGFLKLMKKEHFSDHLIPPLSQVWYRQFYNFQLERRRDLYILNDWVEHWINQLGVTRIEKIQKNHLERDTLLIVLEQFTTSSAVYRCFHNAIQQLRKKFNIVGIVEETNIDENAKKFFDEVIEIKLTVPSDLLTVIQGIQKLSPYAIFFTSVGMQWWSIVLANMRLASLQFMTTGHASTTCSKHMDFVLLHGDFYSKDAFFEEKLLLLPENHYIFAPPPVTDLPPHSVKKADEPLTIVIPASHYKFNHQFLNICQTIEKRSSRPLLFLFTPYLAGLKYHHFKRKLIPWLKNFHVYPPRDYPTYLSILMKGDLSLATFPFGGTNSTIDLLRVGVPIIAMKGADVACSDWRFIQHLDLPEIMLAKDADEYIEAALKLIEDDNLRNKISEQICALGPNLNGLLQEETNNEEYIDAVSCLLTHDEMRASEEKIWILQNLMDKK